MRRAKKPKVISCLFIFVVLLVWTGILYYMGASETTLSKALGSYSEEFLIKLGIGNVGCVNYTQNRQESSFQWKMIFEASPLMTYLAENDIDMNSGEELKGIASIFQGYSSKNYCWSGAASELALTHQIFEESDEQVAKLEGQSASDMAAAENEDELKNDDNSDETSEQVTDQSDNAEKATSNTAGSQSQTVVSSAIKSNVSTINELKKSKSRSYLLKNFYITDSSTSIDNSVFNVSRLLNLDTSLEQTKNPQILIFHTHGASEAFVDSTSGDKSESIVGVGGRLAYILRKKYGYNVIHDTTEYDRINGSIDRNKAYNNAATHISQTLAKYPSVQVVIDLHRDGVGNSVHRTTVINGKRTAQVMFFNGLSRNASGNIAYLYNKNLQYNLAFSLQMKLQCMKDYADFAKPIYLKGYRYNMQLRKRYLLIELGNENNTVAEAKNAMAPLARVLSEVLEDE